MSWTGQYYERQNGSQPAEIFEDALDREHPRLAGKLLRLVDAVQASGPRLGGGYLELCHDYPGLWELRARHQRLLAREFLGFDGAEFVLVHGYTKRDGQPAVPTEFKRAHGYWTEYLKTKRISPG